MAFSRSENKPVLSTRLALARLRAALGVPGAAGQEVEVGRELRGLEVLAEDGGGVRIREELRNRRRPRWS
jgi:hypothetical protein